MDHMWGLAVCQGLGGHGTVRHPASSHAAGSLQLGKYKLAAECFRSSSLASMSKQASAHFNPRLYGARMLLFIVQTEFLQRKESKNQDKRVTNGESFEKAKLH